MNIEYKHFTSFLLGIDFMFQNFRERFWTFKMIGKYFKGGPSPFLKKWFICFNENHLKVIQNAFYFISKYLFVVTMMKLLSSLESHVAKTAWLER